MLPAKAYQWQYWESFFSVEYQANYISFALWDTSLERSHCPAAKKFLLNVKLGQIFFLISIEKFLGFLLTRTSLSLITIEGVNIFCPLFSCQHISFPDI